MKPKKIPMRMCVGCRESKPKRELIRVVRAPDGTVSMDPGGKKPGRGAYVCRQESCLMRAIRQKQNVSWKCSSLTTWRKPCGRSWRSCPNPRQKRRKTDANG